jgi:hypothetical protein
MKHGEPLYVYPSLPSAGIALVFVETIHAGLVRLVGSDSSFLIIASVVFWIVAQIAGSAIGSRLGSARKNPIIYVTNRSLRSSCRPPSSALN